MSTSEHLDAGELRHLAIKALRTGQEGEAIGYLKQALARQPQDSELHYLLGLAHGQIGMVERAAEEVAAALALAPDFTVARFQLGLLHFARRDFAAARQVWAPLHDALPEGDALRLLAEGMNRIGEDRLESAVELLRRGIAACGSDNLKADMQRLVDEALRVLAERRESEGAHMLLSGYQQSRRH
jgi:tetratricopeptide (TPR) repeat protein